MNSEDLKLYPLVDRSFEMEAPDFEEVDNKNWFGSIYYNILDFDTPQGKKYLVFGFDGNTFFNKKKVIDVLHFKDDKPVFGAPVFHRSEESTNHPPVKHRVVKEYYAEARVKLNYDEVHDAIVFDHVIEMGRGKSMYSVPDGTYEGYKYENGRWMHVEKMFDHVYEQDEPPRPEPLFLDDADKKKGKGKKVKRKDLFGNR